jgi:hypothetical protein
MLMEAANTVLSFKKIKGTNSVKVSGQFGSLQVITVTVHKPPLIRINGEESLGLKEHKISLEQKKSLENE